MRRTAFAAVLSACALFAGACADDHGAPAANPAAASSSDSTAPAASGAAQPAGEQDCSKQGWPRPLPNFQGKLLGDTVVGDALCFAIISVTSSDGKDVMHDPAAATTPWTVTGQQPAAGTPVTANTPVRLTVRAR